MFASGSLLWLLQHELRLQWREARRRVLRGLGTFGLFLLLHAVAVPFSMLLLGAEQLPHAIGVAGVSVLLWFVALAMWSRALILLVQGIYQRGDGDLLLASPIPPMTVISARALGIAGEVVREFGGFLFPIANVAFVLGQPRWLFAYLVLPFLALLATAASMLLSRGMFRFMGARRTRILAQVFAAILGSAGLVVTQLPQLWPERERTRVVLELFDSIPPESHPCWWPARVAMGETALGSLTAVLTLIGLFAFSMRVSARGFIADLASASSANATPKRKRRPDLRPFHTDPRFNLIRKELRLLARDPWLMTQLLQQNLYLIPLALALWRGLGRGPSVAWASVVMAATTLSGALAWLAGAGEDAPDLLRSSPLRPTTQWWAKLTAALLPAAALIVLATIVIALQQRYWSALAIAICSSASAITSALLHIRNRAGGSNRRRDLRNRYQSSTLLALVDFAAMMVWVTLATVVLFWEG